MSERFMGIIFGFINLIIGIVFLFFNRQIIKVQGESKKGDVSVDMRKSTFKIVGFLAILFGTFLLCKYL